MNHTRTRASGFTLVELLVVMAIMSILAALLLPVLRKSVEAAHLAVCQSNLKQMGYACFGYADQHDGCLPTDSWWPGPQGDPWPQQIASYIREDLTDLTQYTELWECPEHKPYGGVTADLSTHSRSSRSYEYNSFLRPSYSGKVWRLSRIQQPTTTILIADCSDSDNAYNLANNSPQSGWGIGDRHRGGANIVFVDNHVAFAMPLEIPTTGRDSWFKPND